MQDEKINKTKTKIYKYLNEHQDEIKKLCLKFGTKEQVDNVMESILDERNFIPNSLTLSRIPGIGLIYASVLSNDPVVIASTIGMVSLTDAMDGLAARKIAKNPNSGGALLDCATDKVFSTAMLIPAIFTNPILTINLLLETTIAKVNNEATKKGANQYSTKLGKIKMWPLSATIALAYINMAQNSEVINYLITIGALSTTVLETINIVEYKLQAKENLEKLKKQLLEKNKVKKKTN